MQMSLGLFVFGYSGSPLQEYTRSSSQRWSDNPRIEQRPAHQHIGQGDDLVTLSGTLYPEHTSGELSLELLRVMKNIGGQYLLISGYGKILGSFFIMNITEKQSHFLETGEARKIEFSLELNRGDDDRIDQFGDALGLAVPILGAL
jgi:phage protein U